MVKTVNLFRVSLVKEKTKIHYEQKSINNSNKAVKLFRFFINSFGQSDRENFCVALLDAKNNLLGMNLTAMGGTRLASLSAVDVLKVAVLSNAVAIICCHNHPSGNCTPSEQDIYVTKRLTKASNLLGITFHEHLIISMTDDNYYSFSEHGQIHNNLRTPSSSAEESRGDENKCCM